MPEKEPLEYKFLTYAQKRVLKELENYKILFRIVQVHSNGDVSIEELDTGDKYRINEAGTVIQRPTDKPPSKKLTLPKIKQPQLSFTEPSSSWYKSEKKPAVAPKESYKEPVSGKWKYGNSVCQQKPECCKPREIKAVFFDADHTAWLLSGGIASSITGKLCKIDADTVVELKDNKATCPSLAQTDDISKIESEIISGLSDYEKSALGMDLPEPAGPPLKESDYRTVIKLLPTFRQTLDELNARKIPVSIISLNTPGSVKRIFEALGLADKFYEIRDSYKNKGEVFEELMHKIGECPCSGLFVDDRTDHVIEVSKNCGLALQIGKDKDIEQPIEIFKFIKA